jgi:hypothetical protein
MQHLLNKDDSQNVNGQNKLLSLMSELRSRGLVNNISRFEDPNDCQSLILFVFSENGLDQAIQSGQITAYCGVDPTAASLHLGNLMTLMPMIHLYAYGHSIIPLVRTVCEMS